MRSRDPERAPRTICHTEFWIVKQSFNLQWAFWPKGFWIRVYGCGPHVARDRMVLFSERYGYRKVFRLGRWSFEWLTRTAAP